MFAGRPDQTRVTVGKHSFSWRQAMSPTSSPERTLHLPFWTFTVMVMSPPQDPPLAVAEPPLPTHPGQLWAGLAAVEVGADEGARRTQAVRAIEGMDGMAISFARGLSEA